MTVLTQDIENGFQQKMKTLAVFIDLTKAFDKVWKEGLLFKLLRKTVCGKMYSDGFRATCSRDQQESGLKDRTALQ